ncbi:hypothetical protein QFW77_03980 [Luteimonas sp. RD2P54]|uniref:Uncharacterized protein n=1 Tax=Luteimonas endophytica TaxID=3042023 RepID=A0ABT6J7J2_9GAMM|nr:hypothetical protein [Luteimonas endophytica]MDH5822148.1 hypothetical protein [Luteimonas endophytica]
MIDQTDSDARLDRAARACHQTALERLTPRTLARLRPHPAPAPAPSPRARRLLLGWPLAGAGAAAALALAIGIGIGLPPSGETAAPAPAVVEAPPPAAPAVGADPYRDALAAFEEDPEMFLWLASAEAAPLAME